MPCSGNPSASVFIWYPEGGNIGHASMYIGGHEVGITFEGPIDPTARHRVNQRDLDAPITSTGKYYNDYYVSWWPELESVPPTDPQARAKPTVGLHKDISREDSPPHVVYRVWGLDEAAMRAEWRTVRNNPDAQYHLYLENCSDLVVRILRAGNALSKLNFAQAAWYGYNAVATPRKVAQLCNELVAAGWAKKDKPGHCPTKAQSEFRGFGGSMLQILGLR